ncbi:hypothetical protein RFF05_14200 [Bengtsoniella intestinalis]|uniref:hypothetical protein n=1 Tax=Bengtsoniella intestinalis TaxID=3073143 RepID=UPI00391F9E1F
MILSFGQKAILAILEHVGYIRTDQILALINMQDKLSEVDTRRITPMLAQLVNRHGRVRMQGDIVMWGGIRPVSPQFLEAIDLMIALAGTQSPMIAGNWKKPVLLRFSIPKGQEIHPFSIVPFSPETVFQWMPLSGDRVVFLIENDTLPQVGTLPYKHFFAMRQEDGTHRFFAGSVG